MSAFICYFSPKLAGTVKQMVCVQCSAAVKGISFITISLRGSGMLIACLSGTLGLFSLFIIVCIMLYANSLEKF